ncbi:MAG: hypothetical protein WCO65_02280 [bacterium]
MHIVLVANNPNNTLIEPWLDDEIKQYITAKGGKPELKYALENDNLWHLDQFRRSNPLLVEAVLDYKGEHDFLKVIEVPGKAEDYVLIETIQDGYLVGEAVVIKESVHSACLGFKGTEGVI